MIFSNFFNLIFLKFPIYLPILYGLILYSFPGYESALVFFTLLLLAEPHFGATWPFFLAKENRPEIINNKLEYIFIPSMIVVGSFFAYFLINYYFLIIFFAANVYHVTKQSFGVSKLFLKKEGEIKFHEIVIYSYGFIFFIVGIVRFYLNLIPESQIIVLNLIIIFSIIFILLFYIYYFGFSQNVLSLLTGIIIFYPICFVSSPIHGIIMGVTMHYVQYLSLTYKIQLKREEQKSTKFSYFNINYIAIVAIYGIIMSILSLNNTDQSEIFRYLIILPIIGQLLHFYIDSLLWKFSTKHNRDVTLKFIKT